MSGEDDRGDPEPERSPSSEATEPAPPRVRKAKPPPGIITAGGVDMARAHASGIKPPAPTSPEPATDQPRVVVAVETDPRKVPTHPRLVEGREATADGSRSALLPTGSSAHATPSPTAVPRPAKTAPRSQPAPAPEPRPLSTWKRVAFALALLGVLVSAAHRLRTLDGEGSSSVRATAPPSSGELAPDPVEPAPPPAAVAPPRAAIPRAAAPDPTLDPAPPAAIATPTASMEARPRPARLPLPPPRPAFTPPFQLPGEKN
jgi:hypothetical protein